MWWLIGAVLLSVASAAAGVELTPDPCRLPSVLTERLWRNEPDVMHLTLQPSNVACVTNPSCVADDFGSEATLQDSANVLQVKLQLGDKLELSLGLTIPSPLGDSNASNGSLPQLSVQPMPPEEIQSCGQSLFDPSPLIMWPVDVNQKTYTLEPDLLPASVRLLSVEYASNDGTTGCQVTWRLNVTVRPQECYKTSSSEKCSGRGHCFTDESKASFTCQCCDGYLGRYCEERDACHGNPCNHGGFCVNIAEGLGSTFQCLCPTGFRGQSCEEEVSLCDRKPCVNNATCRGNQTAYWCHCPPGFTGRHCETNVNECMSNPCVHGMCEDGEGAYKCYCLPGYGGDHCEFEYDECDSSPCINGGACEDLVASYRCHCGPGYRGRRCQIKVDLCRPNPCPPPAQCVDRGNNYSCICNPGYNGPGCTQHYDPCYPNPCQNGGSCWPSLDSFFCSCRPGYMGDTCEGHGGSATVGPASVPLDHLHNIYIAAATLAGACLIVAVVVAVCHCRVHKTYLRFTRKLSRSCSELKQQKLPRQVFTEPAWERF